jgi:hypothetical protein
MKLSPKPLKQGSSFNRQEAMNKDCEMKELGDPVDCCNRLPLARSRSIQNIFVVSAAILLANATFAAPNKIDVSSIVTKEDAKLILGADVKDAAPRNVQGGDGYYSKCNYYSVKPGKTLLIRVYLAAPGYDAQKEAEMVTKNTPGAKTISGLGDKAVVTSGQPGGLPQHVTMLYVTKTNSLITVGVSGLDDDAVALEKAKEIAQKILAQL